MDTQAAGGRRASVLARWRASGTDGFTLVELLVAIVVLGALSMAVIGVILNAQAQSVVNRNRVAASNLAARELDMVRAVFSGSSTGPLTIANAGLQTNPNQFAGFVQGDPLVVDGTPYTVKRSVEWNITGSGASACEGGALVTYPSLGVSVTVTWPHMGGAAPIVQRAILTPDKKTGAQTTDSYIATKVTDQDANPLAGVAMGATGPGGSISYTDDTGCAVIKISPATTGSTYTVYVADSSYIDISGATNPSKTTGVLQRATIYSSASFQIAKPGTVKVVLQRADGTPLTAADVAGAQFTLVTSASSGASSSAVYTAAGVTTTLTKMWPTQYGAFFGTIPPLGGYAVVKLPPGGIITLDTEFATAEVDVDNLPNNPTSVLAVPAGTAATCPAGVGTATSVSGSSASLSLLPGTYDLYVFGEGYSCSPGPVAVPLASGPNDGIEWGTTKVRLTGAPAAGKVWALNKAASGLTSLATCPLTSGSAGTLAIDISNARSQDLELPAGVWYVYQTGGAATAACGSFPTANPVTLVYDTTTTVGWSNGTAGLTVTATWTTAGTAWNLYLVPPTSRPLRAVPRRRPWSRVW